MTGLVTERRTKLFWLKVGPIDHNQCWPWLGSKMAAGYGRIGAGNGRHASATHFSLELHGQPRPHQKMCALHKCDNPTCVNPSHLYWGTHADNTRDRRERGRAPKGLGKRGATVLREWAKANPEALREARRKGALKANANRWRTPKKEGE